MADMTYDYLLKTDNPDKELEYFWLLFKSNIVNYLDDNEQKELEIVSDKLNQLQNESKYNKIEKYIKLHIEKIGYSMIFKDHYYKAHHLDIRLKTWKKLTGNEIYDKNNTFFCIFSIYLKLYEQKKIGKHYDDIKARIKELCIDKNNTKILIQIMNISIRHGINGIMERLRYIIDINQFIKKDVDLTDKFIRKTRMHKLCQYMEEIKVE